MSPLSHDQVWAAIDRLAERHDLSPSGLAKRAGLDSTTFNKSKRFAADGRARWPSTESLAKVMEATGASMDDLVSLMVPDRYGTGFSEPGATANYVPPTRRIPLLGMAQAGSGGFFDADGFPAGEGWDHAAFPDAGLGADVYALEITGDSMLPLYRDGDTIIVSPAASVRRGDRVVVKTRDGEVMAKILKRQTADRMELGSANPDHADRSFDRGEIAWIARILWASQ
ncbi:MAG: helix-turn-helix transcriptional regulator [Roseitalea sp.]|nr:helix-turn-helix transcriptional regulator [Roseitalea sp.]MBO6722460.1 helix-turn-helix transcriptional regulator [Roseitalea sp.]MBO6742997.1 helix-turn-helix transcriptional regulator [Roseitalea sp.]